jgi:hypothetical protein
LQGTHPGANVGAGRRGSSPTVPRRVWTRRSLPDAGDTVELFNLVLGLKLTKDEKPDLVAFLRQL